MAEGIIRSQPELHDLWSSLQGLSVANADTVEDTTESDSREAHFRAYTVRIDTFTLALHSPHAPQAATFIYACVDNDSGNWSDYLLSSTAELSSLETDCSDAPRASVCDSDEGDDHLQDAVCAALPGVSDLSGRPSDQLADNADVWRCPVHRCGKVVRPSNLTRSQREVVVALSGSFDAMLVRGRSGTVQLRREDPWKFLRYVDAVAWNHISWHLHRAHISFYHPHPDRPYKECCGWWWNETLLARNQQLLQTVHQLEATGRQRKRQWLVLKAISSARSRVERARARLTRWRYDALQARRDLVSSMFDLNRGVVEVGRSLLALVHQQEADPLTALYAEEISYYRTVEAEWVAEQGA
ncbi:unnamed protein product [Peniophora sp. CBMAI 1063]|nr:unnamed protein product [Peniophora sp. CBMAI 1063]